MTDGSPNEGSRRDFVRGTLLLSVAGAVAGCSTLASSPTAADGDDVAGLEPASSPVSPETDAEPFEPLSHSRAELTATLDAYTAAVPGGEGATRRRHLRTIGEWYLGQFDQPGVSAAAGQIDATLDRLSGAADLQTRVFETIQQDFAADALTQVRGWWLATTEVHLCAVAALLARSE